jgi:hypothetical protein
VGGALGHRRFTTTLLSDNITGHLYQLESSKTAFAWQTKAITNAVVLAMDL